MKYSKYFGAKQRGLIKSISVLAPKGTVHLLNENIRYDICMYSVCMEMIAKDKCSSLLVVSVNVTKKSLFKHWTKF